ncbi:hypothetical protein PROFUN_00624 [Planoprotostelium fungivorum]|uniref:F-box domain-containing protein n=1 Tax=Planoprotostelium fungivorum TaxID=1890364 RepID=A0A2P6NTV9_9EUKA|nr:hypothetical protein PROFUN_00624 [Planoprotostelium fungivorum]
MSTNSVQQIPPDVWTGILSFLPTPDLCISCFTSKTLRDSACHLLDSRASISSLWWRHQKLLPVHNVEIVKWWQSTIREATKQEVIEAVRGDHEEVLDLLGWDDRHLSPHHRLLTRSCQDIPEWNWMDILFEAIVKGSKRVITACHRKKKMDHSKLSTSQHCRSLSEPLGIEGNLEMIQWICGMGDVDGLSADILDPKFWYPFDLRPSGNKLAQHGHRHVIAWLNQVGKIDKAIGSAMYAGAGNGGRMDMITWLEENEIPHEDVYPPLYNFCASLDVFRWALKHNAPHSPDKNPRLYEMALEHGCSEVMKYCFENKSGLPWQKPMREFSPNREHYEALQLAIDHGYISNDTDLANDVEFTSEDFPLIRWLHEREALNPCFYTSILANDLLEVAKWALDNDYSYEDDGQLAMGVLDSGSTEMMEWLMDTIKVDEGYAWSHLVEEADASRRNIPAVEWMLRRKWKKSREEVQRWFDKESEDITNDWLDHLWEFGTEEEGRRVKQKIK